MYTIGSKIIAHLEKVDKALWGDTPELVSCEIDTSNHCQNNCRWCIYKDYLKCNRVHMEQYIFEKVLHSLTLMNCKSITFTGGGEPTMHPRFVDMVKRAYYQGFEIGLITNGIKLHELLPILSMFKFIRVSVDAVNSEDYFKLKRTHVFDIVMDNIKQAVNLHCTDIGISMVYESGMQSKVPQFQQLGENLQVSYTQVKAVVDESVEQTGKEMKNMEGGMISARYKADSHLPCVIAGLIGQVAATGKVHYCCIHRGDDDYMIGDLNKETLQSIMEKRVKFVPDLSKCITCRYMNYAKEYKKVQNSNFTLLRHINFL